MSCSESCRCFALPVTLRSLNHELFCECPTIPSPLDSISVFLFAHMSMCIAKSRCLVLTFSFPLLYLILPDTHASLFILLRPSLLKKINGKLTNAIRSHVTVCLSLSTFRVRHNEDLSETDGDTDDLSDLRAAGRVPVEPGATLRTRHALPSRKKNVRMRVFRRSRPTGSFIRRRRLT